MVAGKITVEQNAPQQMERFSSCFLLRKASLIKFQTKQCLDLYISEIRIKEVAN